MKKLRCNVLVFLLILVGATATSHAQHKYGEVLQKSMFFYEAQRAGVLPASNRVNWRANSVIKDGSDVGADLSKGWFDAGDNVKFNFPMAWSVTVLAWGALEYPEGYTNSGQMDYLLDNIKWVTDYFINCHPSPNKYYYQVGDGNADHAKWTAAEIVEHIMARPTAEVNTTVPGTEVAAETAAAMASASMLFKNSNPTYSATLLKHAKELYAFADQYRGTYPLNAFYKSWSGYNDELTWGAIWLYKATGEASYLTKAKAAYETMGKETGTTTPVYKHTFSWDDKAYASYVLMSQITGEQKYKTDAERYLDHWAYNIERTPAGLPYQADNSWGILRYASNTALCALVYSDLTTDTKKKKDYYDMAKSIVDYAVGNNPENLSYVVGYGTNWPRHIHHRTAHGHPDGFPNGDVPDNRHILYGALVGGPNFSDIYIDDINAYEYTEVACDYNAAFTGVISRMYKDHGGAALTNFPIPETPDEEYFVNLKLNISNTNSFELLGWLVNASAWPARYTENLAFRYYIDITEGVAAGYSANDYVTKGSGKVSKLIPWNAAKNIYYVEVVLENKPIYPGGAGEKQEFVSLGISLPGASANAWDTSNDWSFKGVTSTTDYTYNAYMPIYENGLYLDGLEPGNGGIVVPVESITVSPKTVTLSSKGETATLIAKIAPDTATNKSVTWTSSNLTVSTVSSTGIITVVANGTATITAKTVDGSFTDKCIVTVDIPVVIIPVTGITLSPSALEMNVGVSGTLNAIVSPVDATNKSVTWLSSNTSVATVNNLGVVTSISEGAATITGKTVDGGYTGTCAVTVKNTVIPVTGVTVSPTILSLKVGKTGQLTATVLPANATNKAVNWSSNNISVATISSTGLVSGINEGVADITLTTVDGSFKSLCSVTVTKDSAPDCNFGTPIDKPLTTLHGSYDYVFVIGNGPDLSNVQNFTINWDLTNNGLWQFSINTNDGNPSWWNDLRNNITHKFNSPQPSALLSRTGFTGLDGDYFVAIDKGNFVMVEKSGAYTLYFSKTSDAPCGNLKETGVNHNLENNFSVYPIPSNGEINIDFMNSELIKSIEIYNPLGQLLHSVSSNEIHPTNRILIGRNKSLFILKIRTNSSTITRTIINN